MTENKNEEFALSAKLKQDTIPVIDLPLSSLVLMNDARFPWVILVPRVAGIEEIFELDRTQQKALMEEISLVSKVLTKLHQPTKINVAALGNQVRQLHIHVVARFEGDAAWPGPVWGVGTAEPYSDEGAVETIAKLNNALGGGLENERI